MDMVNIGVIGCGGMAKDLARRCVNMGRARIVAVSDPSPEALAIAKGEFNTDAVADFEQLCKREDVDAVIIGSPPAAHLENVLAAATNKKSIYCEKPLGLNVAECNRMIEACRQAGVRLFVGQVLRLFPFMWHTHQLLKSGELGTARAVAITRTGYSSLFHSGWRTQRAYAGGLLLEMNAHELDYMRFLLGEPVEVYAHTDNIFGRMDYEDQAFVMVSFENGGSGCLHSSLSSPVGEYRMHIQATRGNITHGGFGGTLQYKTIDGKGEELRLADLPSTNPYNRELDSWLDSITIGTEPLFTGEDGRAAVAMAEAAYRSAEEGRPVKIAEL